MDDEYLKKFAQHLKKIRKEKNIKQDDFLDVNGISRSTIAMVETAKTDIRIVNIVPLIGDKCIGANNIRPGFNVCLMDRFDIFIVRAAHRLQHRTHGAIKYQYAFF